MADYAIILNGEIQRFVSALEAAQWTAYDPSIPDMPYLLPVETTDPSYDPISEVKEGPVDTILADKVTHMFTVRAKNAGEIAQMKAYKISAIHNLGDSKLDLAVTISEQVHALTDLIQALYANTNTSGWGSPDQDLAAAALAKINNIQDIRNYEEIKVAEVTALADDPTTIDAYDIEAGW